MVQVQEYNDYMTQAKMQKQEQQKTYNDILSTQIKLKNDIYSRYGTMTENERRFNKRDLSAYKVFENSMTAMVPGINNIPSVGSRPTCRGGKAIVNNSFSATQSPIEDTDSKAKFYSQKIVADHECTFL